MEAPWWARGAHLQTIGAHFLLNGKIDIEPICHEVILPDGDVLLVVEHSPEKAASGAEILLFHGLSGSSDSEYMQRAGAAFLKNGHRVFLVNHRGCGRGVGRASQVYHSGRGEDLSEVIAWRRKVNPQAKLLVIGFSLSGNALLNLLSSKRGSVFPDSAISVNAPIDLSSCATALHRGFNRVYEKRFLYRLSSQLKKNKLIPNSEKLSQLSFKSLRDFDDKVTAPLSGFKSADDYYEKCSTYKNLDKIQTPTLIITSNDDPFVDVSAYRNATFSSSVSLYVSLTGGHMGYLCKNACSAGNSFLERALLRAHDYLFNLR